MKKILFIAHTVYPLFAGDALYNYGLCKEIEKIAELKVYSYVSKNEDTVEFCKKHGNIYLYENKADFNPKMKKIANLGSVFPVDKTMFDAVCREIRDNNYDYVFVSHVVMAPFAIELKRIYPTIKLVYVSHDAEVENKILTDRFIMRNEKNLLKSFRHKMWFVRRIRWHYYFEKYLLQKSDYIFTISKADILYHKKIYKKTSPYYFCKPLINFPKSKDSESLKSFNKRLLIAGTMSWFPNVLGTIWFVDNVMSILAKEGYVLYIVGNRPTKEILALCDRYPDNIIVTGRVPSMDEYFELCDISVVPLFTGTGAKIKVLESIGRSIPTVCSEFASKDYEGVDTVMCIANSPQEFIDSIHKIQNDVSYRIECFEKMNVYYQKYMCLDEAIVNLLK